VLVLTRHCGAIYDLTPEEVGSFGHLLGLVCRAPRATLGAARVEPFSARARVAPRAAGPVDPGARP
jgi:diadenosine tetraphosphate (Ap4A) HIT family hydrolase